MANAADNGNLVLHGRIEHGAVVLSEGVTLPDRTEVAVIIQPLREQSLKVDAKSEQRVKLPLVSSKRPGSRPIPGERVAELLDEEDLSS